VHRASSGEEGLNILRTTPDIGVVLSDQRMPTMTGTEFLRTVKSENSSAVRMILSGYAELNTITDAINQGSIFKFITKPWNDELLLNAVNDAFDYYELSEKNRRLTLELQHTNQKLEQFNRKLESIVDDKTHSLQLHIASLKTHQTVLEHFPFGVVGVDDTETVVLDNIEARNTLSRDGSSMLGLPLAKAFKEQWKTAQDNALLLLHQEHADPIQTLCNGRQVCTFKFGDCAVSVGVLITIAR
jgi:FixJ family two-component response regulator